MIIKDLYNEAIKVMKVEEIDTHESDLYLKATPASKDLISKYEFKQNVTTFESAIDNTTWYDIPFAYNNK